MKMKKLVLILTFALAGCVAAKPAQLDISWIEGCWSNADNTSKEVWVRQANGGLLGFSVSISGNKVQFYELLTINLSKDGLLYSAYPQGQVPTAFRATNIGENTVTFSNPEHDYPQQISYRRDGERLLAIISLTGGGKPNSFDKAKCTDQP
jgi:hypothetical protein